MKVIEAGYAPKVGYSYAILQRGNKQFIGETYLCEEDEDIASSFAGCQFAEIKAEIKALKWKYQELKQEVKSLETLYTQITQLKEFPYEKHSRTCRFIRKQIKIKTEEANNVKQDYEILQKAYPLLVEERLRAAREFPEQLSQREKLVQLTRISEELGLDF